MARHHTSHNRNAVYRPGNRRLNCLYSSTVFLCPGSNSPLRGFDRSHEQGTQMATLKLINYDLNKELNKQNYEGIYEFLRTHDDYRKLSESSYAIYTDLRPDQIFEFLKPDLDGNDSLVVFEMSKPIAGQHKDAEWINARLPEKLTIPPRDPNKYTVKGDPGFGGQGSGFGTGR